MQNTYFEGIPVHRSLMHSFGCPLFPSGLTLIGSSNTVSSLGSDRQTRMCWNTNDNTRRHHGLEQNTAVLSRRPRQTSTSPMQLHTNYCYHVSFLTMLILWGTATDIESFSPHQRKARGNRILHSPFDSTRKQHCTLRDPFQCRLQQSLFGPVDNNNDDGDDDDPKETDAELTKKIQKQQSQQAVENYDEEGGRVTLNGVKDALDELQQSFATTTPTIGNGSIFNFESLNKSKLWFESQNEKFENSSIANITSTVQEVMSNMDENATISDAVQAVLGNINVDDDTVQTVLDNLKYLGSSEDEEDDDDDSEDEDKDFSFSCRIVASSDGKIPTQQSLLPASLSGSPHILSKLDAIYHATSHEQTRYLKFMEKELASTSVQSQQRQSLDADEEAKAIRVLRQSLEDSGFNLMSRRDLDLCQALNNDYLFRLSILEDLSELDESIGREYFPEKFEVFENGTVVPKQHETDGTPQDLLYDGRVLIFWRGYGQELTRGRLLLPKIDYLQASIVQNAASYVRSRLNIVEDGLAVQSKVIYDRFSMWIVSVVASSLQKIPSDRVSKWAGAKLVEVAERNQMRMDEEEKKRRKDDKRIKLRRYGGSTGALTPFMICEVGYEPEGNEIMNDAHGANVNSTEERSLIFDSEAVDHDIYKAMNRGQISCRYDEDLAGDMGSYEGVLPMQLLDRVSISNLLDFTPAGTKSFIKSIFGKNELNEPTYQEVIVVWRPLPPKPKLKPVFIPPKFVYDFADMFDIEGLPDLPKPGDEKEKSRPPLEIRAFQSVPMANLPAVLPKTKLVFGAADALKFDLISITSLILVIGSQRFDNPRLDLLALGSFSFWLFRTVIRYSNKLARYDLLVKKFLTSKITARNAGALKYVSTEAGSYRATRAALVYTWLKSPMRIVTPGASGERHQLIKDGLEGVNSLIDEDKQVRVDISAALDDLEELGLLVFSEDGQRLDTIIQDESIVVAALSNQWARVLHGDKVSAEYASKL